MVHSHTFQFKPLKRIFLLNTTHKIFTKYTLVGLRKPNMSSKATTADQKEIPEIIKDETRAPAQTKKYERGRFLGKVM